MENLLERFRFSSMIKLSAPCKVHSMALKNIPMLQKRIKKKSLRKLYQHRIKRSSRALL